MIDVLGALLLFFGVVTPDVPAFDELRASWRPSDVVVLDRRGEALHEVRVDRGNRRLEWTPLADVSPALRTTIVAAEDRRFFTHGGVDWRAVAAGMLRPIVGGPRRGASTISMQVAAVVDPALRRVTGQRTLAQKLRQMRLAWALEARWSKQQILEAYLNVVTFRGELTGVRAAAAVLFDKAPHGLTAPEAAVIAALVRAPNARADIVRRRATVLAPGLGTAVIDDAVDRALRAPPGTGPRVTGAPHVAARLVGRNYRGGLFTVTTTVDAAVQRAATEVLRRQLMTVRGRHVRDGAVLVVDNASGDVLAYVGSSGELSASRWVDGAQALRQPGSTLKPFLYGLALEQRLITLATRLEDAPLEVPTRLGLYRPHNYDEQFRGLVDARTALASSLNVPAVRLLGLVGEDLFAEQLRNLGFDNVREPGDFYGPALALGSADVTLWQLAGAYRALADGGTWRPLRLTPDDSVVASRRVYSPATAFLVADTLADRESRSATFGLENALATPFWTAVKTGTSKDMRDNWCVGFSRRYTVAVWVGNFSGEPMRNVTGVTGAAPVWLEVMALLHESVPSRAPAAPAGVLRAQSAAAGGEPSRTEWFIEGTEPLTAVAGTPPPAPRILWPVAGTVIAVDPDIPAARQAVSFEARGAAGADWRLDGVSLGAATPSLLWRPRPGRHTLQLVEDGERVRDSVTFEVRGAAPVN